MVSSDGLRLFLLGSLFCLLVSLSTHFSTWFFPLLSLSRFLLWVQGSELMLYEKGSRFPKYNIFHTTSGDKVGSCLLTNRNSRRKSPVSNSFSLNILHNSLPIESILGVPLSCHGLKCKKGKTIATTKFS